MNTFQPGDWVYAPGLPLNQLVAGFTTPTGAIGTVESSDALFTNVRFYWWDKAHDCEMTGLLAIPTPGVEPTTRSLRFKNGDAAYFTGPPAGLCTVIAQVGSSRPEHHYFIHPFRPGAKPRVVAEYELRTSEQVAALSKTPGTNAGHASRPSPKFNVGDMVVVEGVGVVFRVAEVVWNGRACAWEYHNQEQADGAGRNCCAVTESYLTAKPTVRYVIDEYKDFDTPNEPRVKCPKCKEWAPLTHLVEANTSYVRCTCGYRDDILQCDTCGRQLAKDYPSGHRCWHCDPAEGL